MKKLLLLGLLTLPSIAHAQCNGVFPNGTVCGNSTGASATPRAVNPASLLGAAGGTNGQIQYNNAGALGGFTASGDITVNTSTGAATYNGIVPTAKGGAGVSNATNSVNEVLASNGANGNFIHTALMTLLNAVCTASPSTCANFFGYYSPQWFGALCNNTGDDGPAIQLAINAAGIGSNNVRLGGCIYRVVTPLTVDKSSVDFGGAGRWVTVINFAPTGAATLFTIGATGHQTFYNSFHDFSMFSLNSTFAKNAITVVDIHEHTFFNLACNGGYNSGLTWRGGGVSTCLNLFGRDLTIFQNLILEADAPIVLNLNPNIYLSTDHWVFRDIYLVGTPGTVQPCVLAQSGIVITNLIFEGHQAWAGCAGGFSAVDTASAIPWNNLTFRGVRTEQNVGGVGALTFNIQPNTNLRNLIIDGGQFDPNAKGIALRKVLGATISNNQASCAVPLFLDMAAGDSQILVMNNRTEAACTISTGGLTPAAGSIASPTGSAIPAFAMYN